MKIEMKDIGEFFKRHKKAFIISGSVVAGVVIVVTLALCICLPGKDKIATGVVMDGINIGGLSREKAEQKMMNSMFYQNRDITFVSGSEKSEITSADIEMDIDTEKSVEKAYSVGRNSNFFVNIYDAAMARFFGAELNPAVSVNVAALDEIIYELGVRKNGTRVEAHVSETKENIATVVPPSMGQKEDVSKERDVAIESFEKGNFDDVQLALEPDDPGELTYEQIYAIIYSQAKDAEYKLEGKELSIIDEVVGRDVDKAEVNSKLSLLNAGETVDFNVTTVNPEITAESLRSKLFKNELASYQSTYSTSAQNRAFNVSRAADSVNGTILMPGDTFSYNQAIGNPSLANGYKIAPTYASGKTSQGAGGGVCQVSSTLYCAVLYADLEIVERRSHSLTVGYVPKGQDATVSYGTLDFKFRNNTNHPIKINSSAKGGKCVMSIVGTQEMEGKTVKIDNVVVGTTPPSVKETTNPDMAAGERTVTTAGKTGYVVDSTRTVYQNGQVIRSEKLTRSTYKMMPTEVTVGTKQPEAPPAEEGETGEEIIVEPQEPIPVEDVPVSDDITPPPVVENIPDEPAEDSVPEPTAPVNTPVPVVPEYTPAAPVNTPVPAAPENTPAPVIPSVPESVPTPSDIDER